jgi:hypothetical protein
VNRSAFLLPDVECQQGVRFGALDLKGFFVNLDLKGFEGEVDLAIGPSRVGADPVRIFENGRVTARPTAAWAQMRIGSSASASEFLSMISNGNEPGKRKSKYAGGLRTVSVDFEMFSA